ncbi:hypothetical protein HYFRA_00003290 [Hymenoscyphus fraxineus]|uniref:Fatty acid desaturase domain-containing protein n=1 Tax=Hymenoscyphus fraxineus TaxID=746836 RepID=A0A9N9KS31_9HELO|nr:hypothetical protein HYFRA_00003290 [Hymenoscyphus fraxineus]
MSTTMLKSQEAHLGAQTIESDYHHHPSELVKGGEVSGQYTTKDLIDAIPPHCFAPTYGRSLWYFTRDFAVAGTAMYISYNYIPLIHITALRWVTWLAYGYFQGQQFTGIWALGHDAGHGAFLPNTFLNGLMGWIFHSLTLTPYFSWQSTHRRHHIYANNLAKDHNYVPPQADTYAQLMGVNLEKIDELTEDAPLVTFVRIIIQQVFGFPWYLLANITATQGSLAAGKTKNAPSKLPFGNSHFLPTSSLFRPEEAHLILASDVGLAMTLAGLWYASTIFGWPTVALLYIQPYLWLNHWIVCLTYLHHTHPDLPKYEPEAWTFLKGATATIDRGLGFGGKHLMHNVADFHVIHHLFSRIPQYHAEEATRAIQPLLGEAYHEDKNRVIWSCLWESFTKCQYIVPSDPKASPADRVMVYRGGPSPPIELNMGRSGLKSQHNLS